MKLVRITLAILASFMLIGLLSPAVQADDDKDKAKVKLKVEIVSPLSVTTSKATGIGIRRATLNGRLTSLGTASEVTLSFEYWTDTGSVKETSTTVKSKKGKFSIAVSDLAESTTYYFRAKAVDDGSTSDGEEMTFTTKTRGRWWNKVFDKIFNRLMRLFRLPW